MMQIQTTAQFPTQANPDFEKKINAIVLIITI